MTTKIQELAQKDFKQIFEYQKYDSFKETMRDLFLRHKQGQYTTDFFVFEMEIYWRCIVEHFRKEMEEFKCKKKNYIKDMKKR